MSFDPSDRGDVLRMNLARDAEMARQHQASFYRATDEARATARLNALTQIYTDMLRAQPDLWGGGFEAARAAELTLPLIERLIRG